MRVFKIKIYFLLFSILIGFTVCGGSSTTTLKTKEVSDTSTQKEKSQNLEKIGFEKMADNFLTNIYIGNDDERKGTIVEISTKILVKDTINNYIEFEVIENGEKVAYSGQLKYYISEEGREFLAATIPYCTKAWEGKTLAFCERHLFFFNAEDAILREDLVEGMEQFGDYNEISEAQTISKMTDAEKEAMQNGKSGVYNQITTLPQKGTTIIIEKISNVGNKERTLVAELQYNTEKGTFKFIKK